jgi:basic amino acid/polyamine antiporter, APA family
MGPTRPTVADTALVRAIGTRALTASIVNATIGAGIFVLPAAAAARIGAAAPLAYIACAATMALIVTCFAVSGSRVSLTGGIYAYVETAFGPYVGFLAGVLYWLSALLGAATVASALASSAGVAVPGLNSAAGRAAFLVAMLGTFAWLNVRGVEIGARTVELVTAAKLLPLVVFLAVGVFYVHPDALRLQTLPGPGAVGDTVLMLIFAFVGIEVALVPSGEVADPARTVPRAIYLALATTTFFYLAIQFVAHGVLGAGLAGSAAAPLAAASAVFLGSAGRTLMLAGAMVSMAGYLGGDTLGSPRILFAFGRDHFLPQAFARVHARYRTPAVAIVAHTAVVCAVTVVGSFGSLLLLANVAVLSMYFLCCAAAWQLVRRDVRMNGEPFRVPGGATIPIAACVAIAWVLSHATREEFEVEGAVLLAATALFLLRRLRHRSGVAAIGVRS